MNFKHWIVVALALPIAALAQAPAYPSRTVTIVVPSGAGGNPDIAARTIAERLTQRLGKPFVVENRAGATGTIGTAYVAKAPHDGYTLGLLSTADVSINPHVFSKLPYVASKDFVPVVELAGVPTVLAVNADLPVKNVAEFVAYAKARPGVLNYGTPGAGSLASLTTNAFMKQVGIKMTHVPYRGGATENVTALIAGDIQATFVGIPSVREFGATGRVKLLALSAASRSSAIPNVPTLRELGFTDFDVVARLGLFAPTGMPDEARNRLAAEVKQVLAEPEVQRKLEGLGMVMSKLDLPQFNAALDRDYASFGTMVRELGLKAD